MTTICGVCGAATEGFVCSRCIDRLERDLGDMRALLDELTVTITRQGRTYRAAGLAQREAEDTNDPEAHIRADLRSRDGRIALRPTTLPYEEAASDLRWEAWATLTAWARHLVESRGSDDMPTDATLLGFLLRNVQSFAMDEAGSAAVDEIADVHRRLERAIDNSAERIYVGPCGADVEDVVTDEANGVITTRIVHTVCERDLYRELAGGTARCDGHRQDGRGCGARHDLAERQQWFRASIDDLLAPLAEWQAALPSMFPRLFWPNRTTWVRWVEGNEQQAPKLYPHGSDQVGRPLFRGSDVLELVRQQQDRIIGNLTRARRAS